MKCDVIEMQSEGYRIVVRPCRGDDLTIWDAATRTLTVDLLPCEEYPRIQHVPEPAPDLSGCFRQFSMGSEPAEATTGEWIDVVWWSGADNGVDTGLRVRWRDGHPWLQLLRLDLNAAIDGTVWSIEQTEVGVPVAAMTPEEIMARLLAMTGTQPQAAA